MNEQSNYGYTPLGKKWLYFITYVSFPLSALVNTIDALSIDYSAMDTSAKMIFAFMMFYAIALPLVSSYFLHKKRVEGYFLFFITPLSNAFFIMYFAILSGAIDPTVDGSSTGGVLIVFAINYFYIKKRRFMFSHDEIGPTQFNAIGLRTGLIVCISLLIITTLYSSLLLGYSSVDQQAYSDLLAERDKLSEDLSTTNDALFASNDLYQEAIEQVNEMTPKSQFMDEHVRFVTENGTKYHRYECHYITDAPNIYYLFIDDLPNYNYTPCSECNP